MPTTLLTRLMKPLVACALGAALAVAGSAAVTSATPSQAYAFESACVVISQPQAKTYQVGETIPIVYQVYDPYTDSNIQAGVYMKIYKNGVLDNKQFQGMVPKNSAVTVPSWNAGSLVCSEPGTWSFVLSCVPYNMKTSQVDTSIAEANYPTGTVTFTVVGTANTGWKQSSGKWWYQTGTNSYATGWKKIDGCWYYFDSAGWMKTGWQKVSGSWYYLTSSGVMKTGWNKNGGVWYYHGSDGAMKTGWFKAGSAWYYANGSGVMQANRWIGNYYVQADGSMATNKWIGKYHVDANGLWDKSK